MERDRPISQSERFVTPPRAAENGDYEHLAPLPTTDSSIPLTQPAIIEELVAPPIAEPSWETRTSSVQIDPVPTIDRSAPEKHTVTADQIRAKVRGPYEVYNARLAQLREHLKPPITPEAQAHHEIDVESSFNQVATYPTGLGTLSFSELHERSRKYAAYVLHHTYQIDPADIDDGLQAGFEHLWERLQKEPEGLKDKSMAWIGKGLVYQALHAIRHNWTYQKHIQAEDGRSSTDRRGAHALESRPSRYADRYPSGDRGGCQPHHDD